MKIDNLKFKSDYDIKYLPTSDNLFIKSGKNFANLRSLFIDSHLWSVIQQRKSGVISLNHQFISDTKYEYLLPEIENLFSNIDFDDLKSYILEAPLFGFQPIEIIWDLNFGRYSPINFNCLLQENFAFNPDMKLLYFPKNSYEPIPVPEFKLLCPSFEQSKINPYGQAILSKCYWVINFKLSTIRSWKEFSDKFGLPFLFGSYDGALEQTEIDNLVTKIAQMSNDNVLIHPKQIELEVKEIKSLASKEMFNGLINICNTEISKAVLSQTLTTELNIGSYAAASIHYKVRREITEKDIRLVEKTINTLINYYTLINYGLSNIIKFDIVFSNQDNKDLIDRDEKLMKFPGFKFSSDYLKKTYSLADNDFSLI